MGPCLSCESVKGWILLCSVLGIDKLVLTFRVAEWLSWSLCAAELSKRGGP